VDVVAHHAVSAMAIVGVLALAGFAWWWFRKKRAGKLLSE
jgi:LPXTG-motif cell wall-anchored protein